MSGGVMHDLQTLIAYAKCNGTPCSECPLHNADGDCDDRAAESTERVQAWLEALPPGGACNVTVDDLL